MYSVGRNVQCTMYNVQCTMYNVQCTMYNVQCTMYNVQCTMYNVQCTMYNVQCTMYNVHMGVSDTMNWPNCPAPLETWKIWVSFILSTTNWLICEKTYADLAVWRIWYAMLTKQNWYYKNDYLFSLCIDCVKVHSFTQLLHIVVSRFQQKMHYI